MAEPSPYDRVASIVGTAGKCSDDGRALTYGWRIFTNEAGGRGFWNEAAYLGGASNEDDARQWAADHGFTVQSVAWQ